MEKGLKSLKTVYTQDLLVQVGKGMQLGDRTPPQVCGPAQQPHQPTRNQREETVHHLAGSAFSLWASPLPQAFPHLWASGNCPDLPEPSETESIIEALNKNRKTGRDTCKRSKDTTKGFQKNIINTTALF